jgi:hypothetical protein
VPGFVPEVADQADGPARLYAVSETSRAVQALLERL